MRTKPNSRGGLLRRIQRETGTVFDGPATTAWFVAVLVLGATPGWTQTVELTDVALAAGLDNRYEFQSPESGVQSIDFLPAFAGAAAAGDFDGDGWPDLCLTGGPTEADVIYYNRGDGTFSSKPLKLQTSVTFGSGTGPKKNWTTLTTLDRHYGQGLAVGDYDGDGDLDIFLQSMGRVGSIGPGQHRLWQNEGARTFAEVAAFAGVNYSGPDHVDGQGCAFGDYDLDGDLDLITSGWRNQAGGNVLFRNNGDGRFTDVTAVLGIATTLAVKGFTPSFVDMDGDRYPEIVLAADFVGSRYLVNNGDGTFSDFTTSSGACLDTNGMGQTIFDFDSDGLLDVYRTSIDELPTLTGNMLYKNLGNHAYAEVGVSAGVNAGYWGWGTVACDVDNDGLEDLVEVNGFLPIGACTVNPKSCLGYPYQNDPARLWLNDDSGVFTEVSQQLGFISGRQGRGVVAVDYDLDGDEDLVVTRNDQKAQLFRNDLTGPATHWLRIELDTNAQPGLAPNGIGSRVTFSIAGRSYVRYVYGRNTHMGQGEFALHFGMGAATVVDTLTVAWPDGTNKQLTNVAADQALTITP